MRNSKRFLTFCLFTMGLLGARDAFAQAVVDDSRRPPPLEPPPSCELWRGSARGNDPTQVIEMILCSNGTNVHGTFQTSSLNSGWSKRTFVGNVVRPQQELSLREERFVENRPNSGWRFCLIDRYQLVFSSPTHFEADYHSEDCHDNGHISADRIVGADAGVVTDPSTLDAGPLHPQELTRSRPQIILVPPAESTRRRWFGCSVRPDKTTQPTPVWMTFAALTLVLARRRHARS